jgi:16S rRNA (cytosine1402-N4)-methyltransferase
VSGEQVHQPVMVSEVVAHLDCGPGKTFVDATVGGGGHAAAILEASSPDGILVGIDRDKDILAVAEKALAKYRGRFELVHANFRDLATVLERQGRGPVDGLLLDLGISSWQVDTPERGFSFRTEAPLDMRMDRGEEMTAARLIREVPEEKLAEIIWKFGEERRSRVIARAIKHAVTEKRMFTTTALAEVVKEALGGRTPRGRRRLHPATRTFQALRIAVNGEMDALDGVLRQLPAAVAPGGRCCCLAYHSLEDRLVKNAFRDLAGRGMEKRTPVVEVLTKKPLAPAEDEVRANPRSRSARLRAFRKLEE